MKKVIKTRSDIDFLVNSFYKKVRNDDVLSYIFNEALVIDWDKHLPIMGDFWESIILDNPIYRGNAMHVHIDLSKKVKFEKRHFDRWKLLFFGTLDEHFPDSALPALKTRIESIAALMEYKITNSDNSLL